MMFFDEVTPICTDRLMKIHLGLRKQANIGQLADTGNYPRKDGSSPITVKAVDNTMSRSCRQLPPKWLEPKKLNFDEQSHLLPKHTKSRKILAYAMSRSLQATIYKQYKQLTIHKTIIRYSGNRHVSLMQATIYHLEQTS